MPDLTAPAAPQAAPQEAPPVAPPQTQPAQPQETMPLVGRDGGLHNVPVAQAHAAVSSGQFGWVHGSKIPIIDPTTGQLSHVSSEHATEVLNTPGIKLASPGEVAAHREEKKYGGIGGGAAAIGEGLGRGLTAGLSDPLAVGATRLFGGDAAAEAVRTHLEKIQEHNQGLSTGSELLGAVAPMLLGDVAGVGDIVGSIPRGIDAAGELAANFGAKLVGTNAESLLGRVGQKAIKGAAKAMVEGGLWSEGQEVSDATLQNRDLTAESMIGAMGHGALIAGAIGGGLGALEPLAGGAMKALREKSPFDDVLGKAADEQYIRALSPNKKGFIDEMKDRFGGKEATKRIANRMREDGIVQAGDTIESIAPKAQKAEAAAVDNLSNMVDKVGANGVAVEDALQALEKRAQEFDSKLGFRSAASEIRTKMKEIEDIYIPQAMHASEATGAPIAEFKIPIRDLLEQRRGLEGTIDWKTDSVLAQGRKAAGRTLEDVIMNAGDKAAKEAGNEGWKADYLAAKSRYSEARFVHDVATDSLNAKLRNRAMSPSDYAASLAGGNIGGMLGGEGHHLGGGLGGMMLGAVHNQVRLRGNATLAVLLDKLGTFGGMSEAHATAMRRLDGAIDTALGKSVASPKPAPKRSFTKERFDDAAAHVSALASSSAAVDAHLQKQTAAIATHAPDVAKAVAGKAAATLKYLQSKLPASYKEAPATTTLTPHVNKPAASNADMTKFLRAKDASEMPAEDLFADILRGHGGQEEVDALKAIYPATYEEARTRVMQKCSAREHPVPYQTTLRLGMLFDEATTPGLAPDMIQQQQMIYAPKPQAPNPGAPKSGGRGSTQKPLKSFDMVGSMFSGHDSDSKG